MSDHNYINTKYKLISFYHEDSLSSSFELVRKRWYLKKDRVSLQFQSLASILSRFVCGCMKIFHMSGRQFTDLENFWVILNVEKKISSGTFFMKHMYRVMKLKLGWTVLVHKYWKLNKSSITFYCIFELPRIYTSVLERVTWLTSLEK